MKAKSSHLQPYPLLAAILALTACSKPAAPGAQMPQAMPVKVETVSMQPVPVFDQYSATIKSRQSATINPQVDGNLIRINVKSGDRVRAGQVLMEIDPVKQAATYASAAATEQQKLAVYQYNQVEVQRQRKLFDEGVTSRDALDQALQAFRNSKADYESAVAASRSQQSQLGYYKITAPFAGVIGDIPVHLGDYVTPSTMLTTVDGAHGLEAYIYIPAERSAQIHPGLNVEILDNSGKPIERTRINFVSPQVDSQLQGILAKATVDSSLVRNQQLVQARVIWSTENEPLVPVLAVSRLGGQAFVYVAQEQKGKYFARQQAIGLGDTVGNDYAVLSGLRNGEKVIVSGTQFLMDGAPVQPLG